MHRFIRCHRTITVAIAACSTVVAGYSAPVQIKHTTAATKQSATEANSSAAQTKGPSLSSPAVANHHAADRLSVAMRLGDGARFWKPTRREIGIGYAPGGSNNSQSGHFLFRVDRLILRTYLEKISPYVHRLPRDAYPVVDLTKGIPPSSEQVPAKIVAERDGANLDVNAAVDLIQKDIETDPATVHIVLPLHVTPPEVTNADLKGINARTGYFVTHFNAHEVGRTQTVRRAISIIDGHVLEPGAVFSINRVVGERTAVRGFGMGQVFVDGKMAKQLGGGMCQVATTLFNAAMLADLKIMERHQHVRTVPYVPPGRDATVYWGQKDLKVMNDTGAPIYISYKTTATHAIVALFGKYVPGRKVVLSGKHTRLAQRHFTGTFGRTVYYADGRVVKGPFYRSNYKWTPALDFNH